MKTKFAVVGSSCIDIFATSTFPLVSNDSNPGIVNIGFGGVGRNIAENLARLGNTVQLFAAFGNDAVSAQMFKHTQSAGVHMDGCLVSESANAPYYISVNEPSGDMTVAVNDMAICDQLTPEYLQDVIPSLNACDAVIMDANIPESSIRFLANFCQAPLFADAVSTKKALKLSCALPRLFGLNANLREAEALLNMQLSPDEVSLQSAAKRFHALGISYILLTLGSMGAFLSTGTHQLMMSAFPSVSVNANGCGDAFSAAAFSAILAGKEPETVLITALAAAAITAQYEQSVSGDLSPTAIQIFLEKVRKTQ